MNPDLPAALVLPIGIYLLFVIIALVWIFITTFRRYMYVCMFLTVNHWLTPIVLFVQGEKEARGELLLNPMVLFMQEVQGYL